MTRNDNQDDRIVALIQTINDVREKVIRTLATYIQLSTRMRAFENMFQTYVLHPGQQLQAIVQQRKRLEREYNRIRAGIEKGYYRDQEEIVEEVAEVLRGDDYDEHDFPEPPRSVTLPPELGLGGLDAEVDDQTKKRIVAEFKRVVIPKVHADTSDAPFEVFDVALAAYKHRDYLLMEALVIRYREEIGEYRQDDPVVSAEESTTRLGEYRSVLERLEKRLARLKGNMTDNELKNPQNTQVLIETRNREFRQAIDEEFERILKIRGRLETLVNNPDR